MLSVLMEVYRVGRKAKGLFDAEVYSFNPSKFIFVSCVSGILEVYRDSRFDNGSISIQIVSIIQVINIIWILVKRKKEKVR